MIVLKSIEWQGFYSYGDKINRFNFSPGFYLIVGRNGAGKSSFLNLVSLALFDNSPSSAKFSALNDKIKKGYIKLSFNKDGVDYDVVYERGGKYFNWCLFRGDVEVVSGKDTGDYIERLIGFGYEQFVNSYYLSQNSNSFKILFGSPSDRLGILSRIFSLDRFFQLSELAKVSADDLENKIDLKNKDIDGYKQRIDVLSGLLKEKDELLSKRDALLSNKVSLERDLDGYGAIKNELNEVKERIANLDKEIVDKSKIKKSNLLYELDRAKDRVRRIDEELSGYNVIDNLDTLLNKAIEDRDIVLKEIDNLSAIRDKLSFEVGGLAREKNELERDINNILSGEGRCDRCGSYVSAESLLSYKNELLDRLKKAQNDYVEKDKNLKEVNNKIFDLKNKISYFDKEIDKYKYMMTIRDKVNSLMSEKEECIRVIEAKSIELEKLNVEIELIFGERNKLEDELIKLNNQAECLEACKNKLSLLSKDLYYIDDRLMSLGRVEAEYNGCLNELNKLSESLVSLRNDFESYKFWIKGFKEMAILKLGFLVEKINSYLEDFLKYFGLKCWIDVLEEKKGEKDLFTLDSFKIKVNIFVSADDKEAVPIEAYSGGEKQLIMLALVLSIGKSLPDFSWVALDEIFGFLDENNKSKVLDLLTRERLGDLNKKTLFIVTHDEEIKSALDWSGVIEVDKVNGFSEVSYV